MCSYGGPELIDTDAESAYSAADSGSLTVTMPYTEYLELQQINAKYETVRTIMR